MFPMKKYHLLLSETERGGHWSTPVVFIVGPRPAEGLWFVNHFWKGHE